MSRSASTPETAAKGRLVIDSGSANDRSFSQYTLQGASQAGEAAGLELFFREPQSTDGYEACIEAALADGADLMINAGFRMEDATAKAARRHPGVRFAIMDSACYPDALLRIAQQAPGLA